MKYLFLIAGILVFGFVSAQNDEVYYLQKQLKKLQQKKINPLYKHQPPVALLPKDNFLPENDIAYTLANGNKVSKLPQDNMPCIVPDMSQFNMPNAGSPDMLYSRKGTIPNPLFPGK